MGGWGLGNMMFGELFGAVSLTLTRKSNTLVTIFAEGTKHISRKMGFRLTVASYTVDTYSPTPLTSDLLDNNYIVCRVQVTDSLHAR